MKNSLSKSRKRQDLGTLTALSMGYYDTKNENISLNDADFYPTRRSPLAYSTLRVLSILLNIFPDLKIGSIEIE